MFFFVLLILTFQAFSTKYEIQKCTQDKNIVVFSAFFVQYNKLTKIIVRFSIESNNKKYSVFGNSLNEILKTVLKFSIEPYLEEYLKQKKQLTGHYYIHSKESDQNYYYIFETTSPYQISPRYDEYIISLIPPNVGDKFFEFVASTCCTCCIIQESTKYYSYIEPIENAIKSKLESKFLICTNDENVTFTPVPTQNLTPLIERRFSAISVTSTDSDQLMPEIKIDPSTPITPGLARKPSVTNITICKTNSITTKECQSPQSSPLNSPTKRVLTPQALPLEVPIIVAAPQDSFSRRSSLNSSKSSGSDPKQLTAEQIKNYKTPEPEDLNATYPLSTKNEKLNTKRPSNLMLDRTSFNSPKNRKSVDPNSPILPSAQFQFPPPVPHRTSDVSTVVDNHQLRRTQSTNSLLMPRVSRPGTPTTRIKQQQKAPHSPENNSAFNRIKEILAANSPKALTKTNVKISQQTNNLVTELTMKKQYNPIDGTVTVDTTETVTKDGRTLRKTSTVDEQVIQTPQPSPFIEPIKKENTSSNDSSNNSIQFNPVYHDSLASVQKLD